MRGKPERMVTLDRLVQFENQEVTIPEPVTLEGMVMLDRLAQSSNAWLVIEITLEGMITLVRLVQE